MGRGLLLLVSGFVIIFGIVQNSVQKRQQIMAERTPAYFYEEQSRNIAASMMEAALAKFNENFYWTGPMATDMMGGSGSITVDSTAAFGSRVYLTIKGVTGPPDNEYTTTIKAEANRPAFSIYSYFTDEEPVIYFADGDTLNGPVHTNGTFHIDGDPVFNGRVSSPNQPQEEWGSEPEYNQGSNFSADEIALPTDLGNLSSEAQSGGLRYDDDKIRVEFKSDGTADITRYQQTGTQQGECVDWNWDWNSSQGWHQTCEQYEQIPQYVAINTTPVNEDLAHTAGFNGIISSSGLIEVKGVLDGNVTLHSEQDVHIIGDIMYEDFDPATPKAELSSDNLLGIVSEGDVMVAENAHQDIGSEDLNITASIMAMGESFWIEGYDSGTHRGQLRILGGLIQQERGPVGTSGGTGYDKYYSYDSRLLENATPNFPKVKRFEITSWRESTENTSGS